MLNTWWGNGVFQMKSQNSFTVATGSCSLSRAISSEGVVATNKEIQQ